MSSKKKKTLKRSKKLGGVIWHPETGLVFNEDKVVTGRCIDDKVVSLTQDMVDLCTEWRFKYDESLLAKEESEEEDEEPEEEAENEEEAEEEQENEKEEQEEEAEEEASEEVENEPENEEEEEKKAESEETTREETTAEKLEKMNSGDIEKVNHKINQNPVHIIYQGEDGTYFREIPNEKIREKIYTVAYEVAKLYEPVERQLREEIKELRYQLDEQTKIAQAASERYRKFVDILKLHTQLS